MRRVGGGRKAAASGLVSIHRRFAGEWIDFDDQRSLRRRVWPPRAPGVAGLDLLDVIEMTFVPRGFAVSF